MSNNPNYSQDEGPTTDPAYIAAKQVCRYFGNETVSPKVIMFIRAAYEPHLAELSAFLHSGYADANRERDAAAAELVESLNEMIAWTSHAFDADDAEPGDLPELERAKAALARWDALSAPTAPNPEPVEGPASPGAAMRD